MHGEEKVLYIFHTEQSFLSLNNNNNTHNILLLTGRAIQGNILFEIDRIGPTEGRDDTEVENRIFSRIARLEGIAIIDNFRHEQ